MLEVIHKSQATYTASSDESNGNDNDNDNGNINNRETRNNNHNNHNNDNNNNNNNNCIFCNKKLKYFLTICLISGFVLGWTIMSIIALSTESNSYINSICQGKFFWEYLLIIVILNNLITIYIVRKLYVMYYKNEVCNFIVVIVCLVLQLIIVSFGVALLNNNCIHNQLRHTLIYSSIASWILWQSLLFFSLALIGAVLTFCCALSE
jgi:hypothetical protein